MSNGINTGKMTEIGILEDEINKIQLDVSDQHIKYKEGATGPDIMIALLINAMKRIDKLEVHIAKTESNRIVLR